MVKLVSYGFCGLPRWLKGKESTCQCKRLGFDPWVWKVPWRRKWQLTLVACSCLGNFTDRGDWQATISGVAKELDTTEQPNSYNCNMAYVPTYCKWQLKPTEIYAFTVLEGKCPKLFSLSWNQNVSRAIFLHEALREKPFLASSSIWWLPAFFDCGQVSHFNLPLLSQCFPLLYRAYLPQLVIAFRVHPGNLYISVSLSNHVCRDTFSL